MRRIFVICNWIFDIKVRRLRIGKELKRGIGVLSVLGVVAVFVFLGILGRGSAVWAEEIGSFRDEITINRDGTITVDERIEYDFGSEQRHGIFREIPRYKTNKSNKTYKLGIEVLGVEARLRQGFGGQGGIEVPYEVSEEGEDLRIKIGDPDKTVTGVQEYVIRYKVSGALTYFPDHDELYWNVTGNGWEVPIGEASALVKLPFDIGNLKLDIGRENSADGEKSGDIGDQILDIGGGQGNSGEIGDVREARAECFVGEEGSREKGCTIEVLARSDVLRDGEGTAVSFVAGRELSPGEGLTIVAALPKGVVAVLEPEEVVSFWRTGAGLAVLGLAGVLAVFWYLFYPARIIYRWFKYGRDPRVGGAVQAWFSPPETEGGRELTPAEVGGLVDETVHFRDVAAGIVDLARRGYLRIEEREKGQFWLLNKSPLGTNFSSAGKDVPLSYSGSFLGAARHDSKANLDENNSRDSLRENSGMSNVDVKGNSTEFSRLLEKTPSQLIGTSTNKKSATTQAQTTESSENLSPAGDLGAHRSLENEKLLDYEEKLLGAIFENGDEVEVKKLKLYRDMEEIKDLIYERLVRERFFARSPEKIRNFYSVIGVAAFFTLNIPLALAALTFGRHMPRKTLIGARAAAVGESLKNFLESQERILDYQTEHTLPGDKQVLFEKLLGYAVAFGAEKRWAERFKGIELAEPEWYKTYKTGSFNGVAFAQGLGNSFAPAVAATTSTSTSGFSSGFSSSGGFSGGGGGGGGGGSW